MHSPKTATPDLQSESWKPFDVDTRSPLLSLNIAFTTLPPIRPVCGGGSAVQLACVADFAVPMH